MSDKIEDLADYYYRNMTYENLYQMEDKGPSEKQLQLYAVSRTEWYTAVNRAIYRHILDEIKRKGQ